MKILRIFFIITIALTGCSNIPSTEQIESDINLLNQEVKETTATVQKYSGGLISALSNVRLETLKSTKAMLEQKVKGYKRYIPVTYTIDGVKYTPPTNKEELLQKLKQDLEKLDNDLEKAKKERARYEGGLLGILSLTRVVTLKNSMAFLEQKKLLLKYDIPYFSMLPSNSNDTGQGYKSTPGKDIEKF